jgi:hypothetical protein
VGDGVVQVGDLENAEFSIMGEVEWWCTWRDLREEISMSFRPW